LYRYKGNNGENASLIANDVYEIVQENKERLNAAIVDKRDWDYDFFGFKTLERAYLLKVHGKVVERP
jgi:ribonucleotide reductase alpha subunit